MSTSGSDRLLGKKEAFYLLAGIGLAILFSVVPLDNGKMTVLDGFVLGMGLFLWGLKTPGARLILVMVTFLVAIRYFVWRMTKTIYGGPLDLLVSLLLLLAELYSASLTFLGYYEMFDPFQRKIQSLPNDPSEWPSVDVMIPTYNEPVYVVRPTVIAAKNMKYSTELLQVYLLDDGRRMEMKELAKELGVHYVTRDTNKGAKAGNLNEAFEKTTGEIIAIFDCDHVPKVDFLEKTVGQFMIDPNLGLIQTPHSLYSKDPIERNLRLSEETPNESELFYYVILPGKDLWNAAYFCGSAALLRRKSIMKIGGFRTETVTEDAHTSLALHANGYNSAYIAEPLISGLAPDTMADLINQRIRWGRGMIQIFRFDNPLFLKGLSFPQRICYFTSIAYWFFPLARVVFLTAPLPFIYFNIYAVHASLVAITLYLLPYLILSRATNHIHHGRYRQSIWSEVYETAISMHLLIPIIVTFFSPRRGKFSVTPKGSAIEKEFLDAPIAKPNLILLVLNILGFFLIGYRFIFNPSERPLLILGIIWVSYNTIMLILALGATIETRQVRRFPRVFVKIPAKIQIDQGSNPLILEGTVEDLSIGGFSFQCGYSNQILPIENINGVLVFPSNGQIPFKPVFQKIDGSSTLVSGEFHDLSLESERVLILTLFENAPLSWKQKRSSSYSLKKYLWFLIEGFKEQVKRIIKHV